MPIPANSPNTVEWKSCSPAYVQYTMEMADAIPDIAAITALPVRFVISMRALQLLQLIAEKLFSSRNCLKDIRHPQHGHPPSWFLDIGF